MLNSRNVSTSFTGILHSFTPCLMSHVAMCIASSIPTKAVTLVIFHQGFVDGVLEVTKNLVNAFSEKTLFFYLPSCSCSTCSKTSAAPDDLSRITKELIVTENLKPKPTTSASNSSTSSGSSLSTGSFDQLHSQSTKLHIQQSIIVHSYLISLCMYIYICTHICICLCIYTVLF